jgi:hypothetical protein
MLAWDVLRTQLEIGPHAPRALQEELHRAVPRPTLGAGGLLWRHDRDGWQFSRRIYPTQVQ